MAVGREELLVGARSRKVGGEADGDGGQRARGERYVDLGCGAMQDFSNTMTGWQVPRAGALWGACPGVGAAEVMGEISRGEGPQLDSSWHAHARGMSTAHRCSETADCRALDWPLAAQPMGRRCQFGSSSSRHAEIHGQHQRSGLGGGVVEGRARLGWSCSRRPLMKMRRRKRRRRGGRARGERGKQRICEAGIASTASSVHGRIWRHERHSASARYQPGHRVSALRQPCRSLLLASATHRPTSTAWHIRPALISSPPARPALPSLL